MKTKSVKTGQLSSYYEEIRDLRRNLISEFNKVSNLMVYFSKYVKIQECEI
ncbi:hypothetical protein MCY_00189 [Bartonella rattimassiliensis 15908]|uniref:Uncharacterized protein n=1 Tax=Bartonella rattimassiliensis 15908 TaxID=1094556 RepID=J1JTC9_9HYPH|nr:hypothetical protein MCY_00189 [Bartonella rattimassiliensis 15908]